MKALFLIFIFFSMNTTLLAQHLKDNLMQIHATLIPKMLMMDYDFKKRLVDNTISIAIIYKNTQQKNDALALKRYLYAKYPNGFQGHKIALEFISYKKIPHTQKHSLYYFLPSSAQQIKKAVSIVNQHEALSFAYNDKDLKYGIMLSVKITNKVKPIINVDALKKTQVTLRPVLLKVAEIYFQTSLFNLENHDKSSLHIV